MPPEIIHLRCLTQLPLVQDLYPKHAESETLVEQDAQLMCMHIKWKKNCLQTMLECGDCLGNNGCFLHGSGVLLSS